MAEFGRQADLARRLGVTKAAISKAFKKHNLQRSTDGFYNLDYLEWLFKQHQDQAKSAGQRAKKKQPPNIKNPAAIRLVLSNLHEVFNRAIKQAVFAAFENLEDGDAGEDDLTPEAAFDAAIGFWCNFRQAFNGKFPQGLGDNELQAPELVVDYLLRDEPLADLIDRLFVEYSSGTKAPLPIGVVVTGGGMMENDNELTLHGEGLQKPIAL